MNMNRENAKFIVYGTLAIILAIFAFCDRPRNIAVKAIWNPVKKESINTPTDSIKYDYRNIKQETDE